jgi:hypothetical protein
MLVAKANAERVKDAAEAYRYGYPRRGGRDGMTVVAAPTGVFSIVGRVQVTRQGQPLRGLAGAEPLHDGGARRIPVAALIGVPTNNGGRHE